MNKALLTVAICIMIISTIGIIYSVLTPSVNHCAAANPGGIGPGVCVRRESTNWVGIGISAYTLILGIALMIYSSMWQTMRSKYHEKRLITEILFTIVVITLVGPGLFYLIYLIVLRPLALHDGMAVAVFSCIGLSVLVAWYKIRSLLRAHAKEL